eukprot:TRINITY_DN1271_c0_g1_i7.p1 TRINITY_DN1271_c0_g1~~TRINITY_DN1271_c0_g1_i7.p1  ORF type:complete len:691 (+),score=73.76 TRINITY_DN1271_c0_g1_i7:188-2260(+)
MHSASHCCCEMKVVVALCLASLSSADLRMASHPRNAFHILNGDGAIPFVNENLVKRYMIPSTFRYEGLGYPGGQKYNNYDNFLRSNIDNEQDNRDFVNDEGMDHLPFRTKDTEVDTYFRTNRYDGAVVGPIDLRVTVRPGESKLVPLRWNNPHSSELEINIWIFDHGQQQPVVVPIRRPTCKGEGYQDNIIEFTVPTDFADLGAKIPGFTGCSVDSTPMCTVQIYAHSVESRTYALAFPIIILGHNNALTTDSAAMIQPVAKDPWMDLSDLRDLCLSNADPSADIPNAVPRWARLISDVYNHAYQDSDFSPYSGQQHESISKNLQASCILKAVTGNRGELGRAILPPEAATIQDQLNRRQDQVYKAYETIANEIINALGHEMKTTGRVSAMGVSQPLANCFRCSEVGSTNTRRLETNTYIPSFQLPTDLVARARALVPSHYENLISPSGQVQIYVAALNDLRPFFHDAAPYGIIYQPAMEKTTLITMPDSTQFKKRDAEGRPDDGTYAATKAKQRLAMSMGCSAECLGCTVGNAPLIRGATATCVTDSCSDCKQMFNNEPTRPAETVISRLIRDGSAPPRTGAIQIAAYPDLDGSPRFGRPAAPGNPVSPSPLPLPLPLPSPSPSPSPSPPTETPVTTAGPTPQPEREEKMEMNHAASFLTSRFWVAFLTALTAVQFFVMSELDVRQAHC